LDGAKIALHVSLVLELGEFCGGFESKDGSVVFIEKAHLGNIFRVRNLSII
jgi:hypothetical protein